MNFSKIFRVAGREFASTAMTKGFIIGALVVPAVMAALIPLIAILSAAAQPSADKGTVYILDHSTEVYAEIETRLSPEEIRARWEARAQRAANFAKGMMGQAGGDQVENAMGFIKTPEFRIIPTAPDADIEEIKTEIRDQLASGTELDDPMQKILAVIEIDIDAANKANDSEGYGSYQAFFRPKLNEETVGEIESGVRWSIRERRYENAGLDRDQISELSKINERDSKEITEEGERNESSELATFLIPVAALVLLIIATMTGGQYLLTTTIEEKSNRVVEVLLSACSPMELMTGKIVGQMGVGLSLLIVYNSVGIAALIAFNRLDMISGQTIILFFVFFLLAYFMLASMMAAIGAAVNDMREAQSLMTPVMLMMMIPYFFFMPVVRAPNSMLSTVTSFIPPISPFIMIMRISSTDPPPPLQIAAVILVNLVGVVVSLWFAAKVFRVGLLMYGKPPNLRTLIKWIKMA
ncbi:MAG: ABC transporter permease [Phycisphaerales bacterium]|nr:ABC transporter permease [Phycisphaerales bacterium]